MKVYTKVVIDIETGEVLDQEYFEYEGPVALADFGGGDVSEGYEKLAAAYREAARTAKEMYEEAKELASPWTKAGTPAVQQMAGLLGLPGYTPVDPTRTLEATPGYQWALGQGLQALERSAAARGMGLSGPALRAITEYGQKFALANAWQPYLAALQNLSQQGLGAATLTGQQAVRTGETMGQDIIGAGQALLAGKLAEAQQSQGFWNSLLGGLGTIAGLGLGITGPMGLGLWGAGSGLAGMGAGASSIVDMAAAAPMVGALLQEGGYADPNQPYIVGERGPELFVPDRPGVVVPNHRLPEEYRYALMRQRTLSLPYYPLGSVFGGRSQPLSAFERSLQDAYRAMALGTGRWPVNIG